ncbi:hypothetical protein [Pedobacter sp. Leaf194]|nr:hypothetical protein [Pedobacter sp. Leaf194]
MERFVEYSIGESSPAFLSAAVLPLLVIWQSGGIHPIGFINEDIVLGTK